MVFLEIFDSQTQKRKEPFVIGYYRPREKNSFSKSLVWKSGSILWPNGLKGCSRTEEEIDDWLLVSLTFRRDAPSRCSRRTVLVFRWPVSHESPNKANLINSFVHSARKLTARHCSELETLAQRSGGVTVIFRSSRVQKKLISSTAVEVSIKLWQALSLRCSSVVHIANAVAEYSSKHTK